ncbi:hypothetical protein [Paenibacillus sp. HWE-109]|nr:hypothetical protein [Paenibacillus sp. HWE-109]
MKLILLEELHGFLLWCGGGGRLTLFYSVKVADRGGGAEITL